MTPTIWGRWQTRLFLLTTIGFPITVGFVLLFRTPIPLLLLAWVFALGIGWDVLYDRLQQRRWDHDWPPTLQLAAGIAEMIVVGILLYTFIGNAPAIWQFLLHYWSVWVATFIASQSLMRLIFPRWRYYGGEWL